MMDFAGKKISKNIHTLPSDETVIEYLYSWFLKDKLMLRKTIFKKYFEIDRHFYKGGFHKRVKYSLHKLDYVFAANRAFMKKYGVFKFVWRFTETKS